MSYNWEDFYRSLEKKLASSTNIPADPQSTMSKSCQTSGSSRTRSAKDSPRVALVSGARK